ncbi:MAG: beta/gamma crystallin-related protein [Waterburya sp.]
MSKINNHGIGINKMNLAIDLQELTCEQAAAIQGGARIILYEDANFQGNSLAIDGGAAGEVFSLSGNPLNNNVSSIRVESGQWSLFSEDGQTGVGFVADASVQQDLVSTQNDIISSLRVDVA